MLEESLTTHRWKCIIVKNKTVNITHLAFFDDIIIFCQGNNEGLNEILQILHNFYQSSGQMINYSKSQIIFHKAAS